MFFATSASSITVGDAFSLIKSVSEACLSAQSLFWFLALRVVLSLPCTHRMFKTITKGLLWLQDFVSILILMYHVGPHVFHAATPLSSIPISALSFAWPTFFPQAENPYVAAWFVAALILAVSPLLFVLYSGTLHSLPILLSAVYFMAS